MKYETIKNYELNMIKQNTCDTLKKYEIELGWAKEIRRTNLTNSKIEIKQKTPRGKHIQILAYRVQTDLKVTGHKVRIRNREKWINYIISATGLKDLQEPEKKK